MHIRKITRTTPAPAFNIQIILDVVLQLINTARAIEQFIGGPGFSIVDYLKENTGE